MAILSFLAELSLLFNWKYFWGWSLMWMMCGWHESEISGEISLADDICHPDVIRTLAWVAQFHAVLHLVSSACHLHIIHTSSAQHLQTHMSSTHHPHIVSTSSTHRLHVVCTHMSSACHPHTSLSCPISCSTTPGVICTSSADTHVIRMSSAHHLQIHTSFAQSSWTPIVFLVPKMLVIDVTVVPDVVPDVALLKTYCLHIIPSSLHCPYGPQLCFLSQKY